MIKPLPRPPPQPPPRPPARQLKRMPQTRTMTPYGSSDHHHHVNEIKNGSIGATASSPDSQQVCQI